MPKGTYTMETTQKNILQYENTLPENFDGTFRFTNWTDEDFIGKWGGKEYKFPAKSTSPIIMTNHTPLEIQSIRKKFAKNLAEREFGKTDSYKRLVNQEKNNDGSPRLNSIHQAGTYSIETLAPLIQKCLEPLQLSKVIVSDAPHQPLEEKLSKGDDGTPNTVALDKKTSLRKKALEA